MRKRFKRLIIHAGMPKTGSTSLQKAFFNMSPDHVAMMDMGRANQSIPCNLWFGENIENLPNVRSLKRTPAEMMEELEQIRARVHQQLDTAPQDTLLISAEALAQPCFDKNDQLTKLRNLREEFTPYFNEMQVYAYVRPPGPFLTSFFQHRLKRGDLSFALKWVHYRARFEPLHRIFGRENTHLRLYDPGRFPGRNVIADFWEWMGWGWSPPQTRVENTSLNAAGVALISCFTRNCPFERTKKWFRKRDMAVELVKGLDAPKFSLGEATIAGLITGNEADMGWINAALGEDITHLGRSVKAGTFVFDTQDELKRAAALYAPLLDGHPPTEPPSDPDIADALAWERLSHVLDRKLSQTA